MNKKSLLGLVSVGIIIGVAGSSYFSNESSPSALSPVVDNRLSVNENEKTKQKVTQYKNLDDISTSSIDKSENQSNLSSTNSIPDSGTTPLDSISASDSNSEQSIIGSLENNVKANTAENMLMVTGNVGALTWEPSGYIDYENLQIQLSGPNNITIVKDYYSGEVASITESLPDGYYNWQSVTTPTIDPYIKQQLTALRQSGNSIAEEELKQQFRNEGSLLTREQAKNNVQSGGFRIVYGEMLDGSIRE